jgi:hypothetical protein
VIAALQEVAGHASAVQRKMAVAAAILERDDLTRASPVEDDRFVQQHAAEWTI